MIDILIAEDEPAILDPLSFILEHAGYRVDAVVDGEAAFNSVRRKRPRLLLLDIMLPRCSGLDVLKILCADPDLADIPILILTARGPIHLSPFDMVGTGDRCRTAVAPSAAPD